MEHPKQPFRLVNVFLLAFSISQGVAQPLPEPPAELTGLSGYVTAAAKDWRVPGLALAVVKDGKVAYLQAFGVRELGKPGPVDSRTLFAIGSTTKAMTAALIGMLIDEGKLKWDDRVVDHLPDFQFDDPYVTRELTVRDLLTHRGGLGNADFLWYGVDNDPQEILHRMRFAKPAASLRSRFIYQNIMYAAAGQLASRIEGKPWPELIRSRIFEPLGMSDTVPLSSELATRSNVASPHYLLEQQVTVIENASVDSVAPAGSIWSSVNDMSKWLIFLLGGGRPGGADAQPLLKEASLEELFTPQFIVDRQSFYPTARLTEPHWTTYGLGWFQQDYKGRAVNFHTGSIDGMSAIAALIRDEKIGFYMLANLDHAELRHALMLKVFDLFAADASRDWSAELLRLYQELREKQDEQRLKTEQERIEGTSPTLPLESYAGRYEDPLFGQIEIALDGEKLRLKRGPGLTADLHHWNYDTFAALWDAEWRGRTYLSFQIDRKGAVAAVEMGGARLVRQEKEQQ